MRFTSLVAAAALMVGSTAFAAGTEFEIRQKLGTYRSSSGSEKVEDGEKVKTSESDLTVASPYLILLSAKWGKYKLSTIPALIFFNSGSVLPFSFSFMASKNLEVALNLALASSNSKERDIKTSSSQQSIGVTATYYKTLSSTGVIEVLGKVANDSDKSDTKNDGKKNGGESSSRNTFGVGVGYALNINKNLVYFAGMEYQISSKDDKNYDVTTQKDIKTKVEENTMALTLAEVRYIFD